MSNLVSVNSKGLSGLINTGNTCYMNSAIQALCHNNILLSHLLLNKEQIIIQLKHNAGNILRTHSNFDLNVDNHIVSLDLKKKIHNENYHPNMLSEEEMAIVLRHTITFQLISLMESIWSKNCVIMPTSFRYVFSEVRNKFFFGYEQHDAEEAYSCILQQLLDEISEKTNVALDISNKRISYFYQFVKNYEMKISQLSNPEEKKLLMNILQSKRQEYPNYFITIDSLKEIKNHFDNNYSRVLHDFTGFLHSSISCPETNCDYASHRFEPFLHLSLPIPNMPSTTKITIEDCMNEFCRGEILDNNNLWLCEKCNKKVNGIKKMDIWLQSTMLVIQLKRFTNKKNTSLIDFPLNNLKLDSMISKSQMIYDNEFVYRLQCVINHSGSMNAGHYYTYCLNNDNQWYEFNDHRINPISEQNIVTNKAYLLFYIQEK